MYNLWGFSITLSAFMQQSLSLLLGCRRWICFIRNARGCDSVTTWNRQNRSQKVTEQAISC